MREVPEPNSTETFVCGRMLGCFSNGALCLYVLYPLVCAPTRLYALALLGSPAYAMRCAVYLHPWLLLTLMVVLMMMLLMPRGCYSVGLFRCRCLLLLLRHILLFCRSCCSFWWPELWWVDPLRASEQNTVNGRK